MGDEKIAVATIQNYGDILCCGVGGELVQEHDGPELQVLVKGSEKINPMLHILWA